jgi:glycosyltransferase involved in cell wall biosynthesis
MKRKVLHILPSLTIGGAERLAVHLIAHQNHERYSSEVVSLFGPTGSELERMLMEEGVEVHYLGKSLGFDFRMFGGIDRVIRRFRPDIVHSHLGVLRYTLPASFLRRVPVKVHTIHNMAEREVDPLGRWVHHLAFRIGVVPVAIASEVAASLHRVYQLKQSVPLIPNGVPVDFYRRPATPRTEWRRRQGFSEMDVLYLNVGRLMVQKNQALLIDAFASGPARLPDTHLLIIGDGQLRPMLEDRVTGHGLDARVHFLGVRSDIPDALGAADVFVLSSDWEGNPLSVMEAMSAGMPVISTAVGGVPELVQHGATGLLVGQGDTDELALAMTALAHAPDRRASMGTAAGECAAKRFDVEIMTHSYEALYEQLLAASWARGRPF